MNDLLEVAVAARGGLDRWNQVKSITVGASITGALWSLKGQDDALKGRSLRGGHHAGAADDGFRRPGQAVGLRAPPSRHAAP